MDPLSSSLQKLVDRPESARRIGPFVLVEQLGRGGFAPVWLAKEVYGSTELRTAAVKLFALRGTGREPSGAVAARILEEARALCRVEHPNVVRFYALPVDENEGVMGVAMEHVAGVSVDRKLATRGSLSAAETIAVGCAIASALAAVHRAGLVHRDVKPSNVVEAGGIYKLIDFGIAAADAVVEGSGPSAAQLRLRDLPSDALGAKLASIDAFSDDPDATARIALRCGTIGYIDPACMASAAGATPASDLYALGATLFQCLTGRLPASNEHGGLAGHVLDGRRPAPAVQSLGVDVPNAIARIVDALLAPDPRDRPRSAEAIALQLEQARAEVAGSARALPPESVGPFRGLGRFEEGDRDVYFGRTTEIAATLEKLRGQGLVALVGPSGSGKSSLARAGVLPALQGGALGGWPTRWDRAIVSPGVDPRAAILAALHPYAPDLGERPTPESIVAALATRAETSGWGLVLVIDQLEELATVGATESSAWTARLIARFGREALPGVRCVVAVRRDLLDPLLALEELGEPLVRGLVLVEPIRDLAWGEILDRALGAYGYALEDNELRDELMSELRGTASAMPLVQFALTELWDKRDIGRKRITRRSLEALGGISGALGRHAEATIDALAHGDAKLGAPGIEAARRTLLALTTAQGTRRSRTLAELVGAAGEHAATAVAALEKARLIVADADGVMLAHEAVLTQWSRLREWVAEARADRVVGEELERDAAAWRLDRESAPLWRGRRLAFAEELLRRGTVETSPDANAFARASRASARRTQLGIGLGIAAVVLSLAGAGFSYVRGEREARAEQEQRLRAEKEKQADIEEKQSRIDALLQDLDDSETKQKALALQAEIHEAAGLPPVATASEPAPSAPSSPTPPVARPILSATATPSAVAAQPAPSATAVKFQREWK